MPIKLIAYHVTTLNDGVVNISDSFGNSITSDNADKLWNFLYTCYRDRYSRELKFFWNLDESLSNIFRLMPKDDCRNLLKTSFKDATHLYYRKGLNLIIKGDHRIGDNQYWSCLYSLDNLVKSEVAPQNATELLSLGNKFLKACENIGITTPMTLNSAIGIYESSMRKIELTPDIKTIPVEATDILNYAKHCANRQGWITNYKVGHFDNIYSYDVSGSYAYWLSKIRDYSKVEYTRYTKEYKYKSEILKGNISGYFRVKLEIFDYVKVHPFAYVDDLGNVIYPTGTFETYLTLEEILAVYKYKVGTIEILDGWYIRFLNYGKSMMNIVDRLFKLRELGEIENTLCKGILVGYVGKMNAQFDDDNTSRTYNPLIPAWIYAQARLQVFKFIVDNNLQDDLVAVATDGVLSLKPATKTELATKRLLGSWRFDKQVPALILSPGWIIYKDKKPHSITYDIAMELIQSDLSNSYYRATVKQRVTLFEATEILSDLNKVGLITDHYNSIDLVEIQMAQDRVFKKFPKTGRQLLNNIYDSEPIKV